MGGTSYVEVLVAWHPMECWLHDFHEDGDGMVGYEFDITWWWVGNAYEAIGIVNGKGDEKGGGRGWGGDVWWCHVVVAKFSS